MATGTLRALSYDRESRPEEGTVAIDRLIYFSDAVFAIAMTLLVLAIPRPSPTDSVYTFLTKEDTGKFIAYFISFWVIAIYWLGHHRLFRFVRRYDQGLLFLNLVLLFFVAFLPYPSAILGDHNTSVAATNFYAISVAAAGAASTALAWYATVYRRFTGDRLPPWASYYVYRGLIVPIVFLASIPVAQVSTAVAQDMWLITFVPVILGPRVVKRLEAREAARRRNG